MENVKTKFICSNYGEHAMENSIPIQLMFYQIWHAQFYSKLNRLYIILTSTNMFRDGNIYSITSKYNIIINYCQTPNITMWSSNNFYVNVYSRNQSLRKNYFPEHILGGKGSKQTTSTVYSYHDSNWKIIGISSRKVSTKRREERNICRHNAFFK